MRAYLAKGLIHEVLDFGSLPVFTASTYPAIFTLSKETAPSLLVKRIRDVAMLNIRGIAAAPENRIEFSSLGESPWNLGGVDIISRLTKSQLPWKPLDSFGHAYIGALTGMDAAFVLTRDKAAAAKIERDATYPYAYRGEEVERFGKTNPNSVVIYPYREGDNADPVLLTEGEFRKAFPKAYGHLLQFRDELEKRMDSRRLYAEGENWFRHLRPGSYRYIHPPKLLIKGIDKRATVGILDGKTMFNGANCPGFIFDHEEELDQRFILGLMNSKLASYYLRLVCPPKLSGYLRFNASSVNTLPIRVPGATETQAQQQSSRVIELVEILKSLRVKEKSSTHPQEKDRLHREIDATDRQIDQLVYELYGLSEEEIRIVEEATTLSGA